MKIQTFCEQIRERRLELGLTLAAMIEMSGLGKTTIYEIENRDLKNLGFIKANQLLAAQVLDDLHRAWRTVQPTKLIGPAPDSAPILDFLTPAARTR